jgi:hypothetical protein
MWLIKRVILFEIRRHLLAVIRTDKRIFVCGIFSMHLSLVISNVTMIRVNWKCLEGSGHEMIRLLLGGGGGVEPVFE